MSESDTKSESKRIIVQFEDNYYDVTNFDHPGEGIKELYLANYHGKNIDRELEMEHSTNDPYEMLLEAKEKGECDGIIYLDKNKV